MDTPSDMLQEAGPTERDFCRWLMQIGIIARPSEPVFQRLKDKLWDEFLKEWEAAESDGDKLRRRNGE